ncbi:MAG TPA: NUMOD4 motif-containing HNH endonuclease [Ohtaekwangia sp.]|nr:NUMOD4 motif-containing HNH endonuclease [Ohtaekwangia sp.]
MNEIWKKTDIRNEDGFYEVSNYGRARNTFGEIKIPRLSKKGYYRLQLFIYGKKKCPYLHRLVAKAFLPNPNNLPQVNHIDCDKTNNNINNLEWCTNKQNYQHSEANGRQDHKYLTGDESAGALLTNEQAEEIRKAILTNEFRRRDLANLYNVGEHVVKDIRSRRTYV